MFVCLVKMGAEVCVQNHTDLVKAWKMFKGNRVLVGTFKVRGTLTPNQRKRLHADLRSRLVEGWNGE